MKVYFELLLVMGVSMLLALILIPSLRKLALLTGLVDHPNLRKVHHSPVPLVGGIGIFLPSVLAIPMSQSIWNEGLLPFQILAISTILLLVGVMDDKMNVKAIYRLIIQIGCAYAAASLGIRIDDLHGIFGVGALNVPMQYLITVFVITGAVNAFNLMDGIDGLAGSLALLAIVTLGVVAAWIGQTGLMVVFAGFFGAILGFLRFNLSEKKVFMGDGGSLMIGFFLIVAGIRLWQLVPQALATSHPMTLWVIASVFFIPVLDALRVFSARMRAGKSAMHADKTHLHHLLLLLGLSHKQAVLIIGLGVSILMVFSMVVSAELSATFTLLCVLLIFRLFSRPLMLHKQYLDWKSRLEDLERE